MAMVVYQPPRSNGKKLVNFAEKPSNEYVLNVAFYSFVGFMLFQAGFAVIANSASMLADCEAMAVDAMTYLFNLCAERIKNKPLSDKELAMPEEQRSLRREEQRLWLELIPPLISVTCLIVIVIMTMLEAIDEFRDQAKGDDDVSVPIMLIFSGANLLLDFVNVVCFARSGSTFGIQTVRDEHEEIRNSFRGLSDKELESLKASVRNKNSNYTDDTENGSTQYGSMQSGSTRSSRRVVNATVTNLNMCSAWTVRSGCVGNHRPGGLACQTLFFLTSYFWFSQISACLCRYFAQYFRAGCSRYCHSLSVDPRRSERLVGSDCCICHHSDLSSAPYSGINHHCRPALRVAARFWTRVAGLERWNAFKF